MMKKHTLKNGIPVIIDHMPGTKVITALVLFKVGSRNENKKNNGVSHFVEHLFFKGTERRPTSLELTQELDGVGAEFNAFTGKDYTGYYIKVANRNADLAIDILEDLLFHPIFDPAEIDRERGVIIEEIHMYEDNPMRLSEEYVEELMYGANHPLGYLIAGPEENIRTISRNSIIKYRDTYYHTDNMVIIVTGNIPKQTLPLIKKKFENAPKPKHKKAQAKKFTNTQKEERIQVRNKKTSQAHLALTFPGPSYSSKDLAATKVLSTILGSSMSSRLFINVRERQGLCYYIGSHVSCHDETGAVTIQAGFDVKRIHQAIQAIMKELVSIRDEGITPAELKKAKEYIRGKMSINLEDSEHVADWWGTQALFYPQMKSPEQSEKDIQSITEKDVLKAAQKIFQRAKANLVIIGPYSAAQEKKFKKYLLAL